MRDDVENSSLLVVRLSALGDIIHTIPAVVALRDSGWPAFAGRPAEAGPPHAIDWVVESPYRELVEIVARVNAKPVSLKRWSLANIAAARRAVRGHDIAIDFQGLLKSALLARASGARERYGFAPPFIREKPAAWFINRHVDIDPSAHVVEWNLQLARALQPGLQMPDVDFRAFAAVGGGEARKRVVLVPGAGRPEKQWPVERFRELARRIGQDALVVWGPSERAVAEQVGAELAPATNLRQLARVLADAQVVVAADTGPLHLAAALGTRVIGLYGPTNPARNGPYGQIANCVSTFATSKSMMDIEVDDVMKKL